MHNLYTCGQCNALLPWSYPVLDSFTIAMQSSSSLWTRLKCNRSLHGNKHACMGSTIKISELVMNLPVARPSPPSICALLARCNTCCPCLHFFFWVYSGKSLEAKNNYLRIAPPIRTVFAPGSRLRSQSCVLTSASQDIGTLMQLRDSKAFVSRRLAPLCQALVWQRC